MKAALVLRPEPGNAATASRLAAIGVRVRCCPLFAVRPLAWTPPDPTKFDALLLTSANAVRHAGPDLARLAGLPVLAVGPATARGAEAAGLRVAVTGASDAAALLAEARERGWRVPLHLTGAGYDPLPGVTAIPVYASEPLPVPAAEVAAWPGHVALLHSPRAAARFAALVDAASQAGIAIAALSPAVAQAAGPGWTACAIADAPRDEALVDAAAALIDPPGGPADKRPA